MSGPGIEELERRLERSKGSTQFLQLVTRTFASLSLNDLEAIADTAASLSSTFLEVQRGATLFVEADGTLVVGGSQGFSEPGTLASVGGQALWAWVMDEKVARVIAAKELEERWPDRPSELEGDVACVALDVRDVSKGVIVLARKHTGAAFTDEDLEFLSCVAGIVSMALVNAEGYEAQQALIEEAASEAAAKEQALVELDKKLEIIERQKEAIGELSTPILSVWDDVLALPIIGVVDSRRSAEIMEKLLSAITQKQARHVILDITGVEIVDIRTADHMIKLVKAAQLLGAQCIITGIRPAVAQTLVDIGMDLSAVETRSNLKEGLIECFRALERAKNRKVGQ